MIVMGLDTTGAYCSVSIVNDAQVLAHISEKIGRGHAEALAPMVERALAQAGLASSTIEKLAVCTGPGSFTGLRVALSFAKGFALPRNLPVIGLDALAVTYMTSEPDSIEYKVVYQDVRRNEFMFGTYAGKKAMSTFHPTTGSMADVTHEAQLLQIDTIEVTHIDTRILAWLVMDLSPEDYPATPLYSRAPDAKLPGGVTL